jgi:ankyrin repeat protein
MLINYGSDINVLNQEGISPLHQVLLSASINIELLKLLLSHGAKTTFGNVSELAMPVNNSSVNDLFEQYGG